VNPKESRPELDYLLFSTEAAHVDFFHHPRNPLGRQHHFLYNLWMRVASKPPPDAKRSAAYAETQMRDEQSTTKQVLDQLRVLMPAGALKIP
jgi:hypothetical protein